jgi:hypothetical protein
LLDNSKLRLESFKWPKGCFVLQLCPIKKLIDAPHLGIEAPLAPLEAVGPQVGFID